MLVVRPARLDDFEALWRLAEESGPGFTSLPVDEPILREKLTDSVESFAGRRRGWEKGRYLLMLEQDGVVVGCGAVKAAVGLTKPFFNYRVLQIAQSSVAGDRRFDMDVLVLVNEYSGCTEVGTLFLSEQGRGSGAGRLLAQSRYLLIASDRERFAKIVLAELRGVVHKDGHSPFWDNLGERFFRMGFSQADHMSGVTDGQFILDLMPKYPVYVDLLPAAARDVIGQCHPDGEPAMRLLEWEGFRKDKVVDIFDGGPLVSCPRDNIRTISESRRVRIVAGQVGGEGLIALVSTDAWPDFRVTRSLAVKHDRSVTVPTATLAALGLKDGDMARVWIHSKD